jgi:dienelactone hydrolase
MMRPFEILLCCLTALASLPLLFNRKRGVLYIRLLCLLLISAVAFHLAFEGVHWQLAPLYLSILLIFCVALNPMLVEGKRHLWLGLFCGFLVSCSALLSYLLPMFRFPTPSGPYAVGTRILYMVDRSRDPMGTNVQPGKRELMVQIWYPARPAGNKLAEYRRYSETTLISSYQAVLKTNSYWNAAVDNKGAPYPLLIFNHAWTGQRTQDTFLMQELASHGFVVASIDHTYYSGKVAFPDGRVIDSKGAPDLGDLKNTTVDEEFALGTKYTEIEARDDIFVLDQLQLMDLDKASFLHGTIDLTRVGTFGHSLGGSAAAEACYLDPRIKAALNMDGWMFGQVLTHGLSKPLMLIYEKGTEVQPSPAELAKTPKFVRRYWKTDAEDDAAIEAGLQRFGGYRLYIDGTSHWNFSDRALYSPLRAWTEAGPIQPLRAYEIVNRYTLAFFSHTLNGTQQPLLEGTTHLFPEVYFESWKAPATVSISSPKL